MGWNNVLLDKIGFESALTVVISPMPKIQESRNHRLDMKLSHINVNDSLAIFLFFYKFGGGCFCLFACLFLV